MNGNALAGIEFYQQLPLQGNPRNHNHIFLKRITPGHAGVVVLGTNPNKAASRTNH
jgi:hypothetical protein